MAHRITRWPVPENVVGRLASWANKEPARVAFRFIRNSGLETEDVTFGALHARAMSVAIELVRRHGRGNRALIALPQGLDFITAFLGCLYAGAIAVPVHVPRRNRHLDRFVGIARNCGARFAFASDELRLDLERGLAPGEWGELTWLSAAGGQAGPVRWDAPYIDPNTPAFLQYTSGSTAEPRGAVVTHGNLEHNLGLLSAYDDSPPADQVVVSWLPLFHDFGLISGMLGPVFHGATAVLMAPATFLNDPLIWMRAIARFRGTYSAAPNFALDLCVARATAEEVARLDLNSLRCVMVGAEPILPGTLERFARAFAPAGFRFEALRPGFGLAEATLIVTGAKRGQPAVIRSFGRAKLQENRAEPGEAADGQVRLVSSGRAAAGTGLLIVDPETRRPLEESAVGEIWVSGPSVARGYWRSPEASGETFLAWLPDGNGPFMRTGDLGFLDSGELFVTGRLKDLIIIGGANHYPQDIEITARAAHPALHDAAGAAFGILGDAGEELAVVHEINLGHRNADPAEVFGALRQAVSEQHQLAVVHGALVRFGSLPKTTSGKIRRRKAREIFLSGALESYFSTDKPAAISGPVPSPAGHAMSAADFERLRAAVARVLGISPDALDPNAPLLQ